MSGTIAYVDEANPFLHNVLFSVKDGICRHRLSDCYTFDLTAAVPPYAVEGAAPFIDTIIDEEAVHLKLKEDIASRLTVEVEDITIEQYCIGQPDLAATKAQVVEFLNSPLREGDVHLFGSYYLKRNGTYVGERVGGFLGENIHVLNAQFGRTAENRDKGALVVTSHFNHSFFSTERAEVRSEIAGFLGELVTA